MIGIFEKNSSLSVKRVVEPCICHNLKNNYLFFSFLTKKRENELRIFHGSILVNIRILVNTRLHNCNKSPNCSQTWLYLTKLRQVLRQKSISKSEVSSLLPVLVPFEIKKFSD